MPAFTVRSFKPRSHKYCVSVFVLNEGERIRAQLSSMARLTREIDVIVADGGSTDGSLDEDVLRARGVRTLLVKTGPGKLSAQMRMALRYALDEGYEGAIVIDGNNKDDVSAIPRFMSALDAGYDHVQGSRYVPGGRGINTPRLRHYAVRWLHAPLLSLAAGRRYTDTTNGFRAYSRRLLTDPRVQPFRDVFVGYELHYYLAIRAARLGFRVTEVPVTREYPPAGRTPTKISPIRGNLLVLAALCRACLHLYDPEPQ